MTKQGRFDKVYTHELLSIAEQNLASAEFLAGHPGLRVENTFLLAQQALEKALKALICWQEAAVPFVNEIGILVTKVEGLGLSPLFGYDLNGLSEFATIRRYLEGREQYSSEEVKEILSKVRDAVNWCRDGISGI